MLSLLKYLCMHREHNMISQCKTMWQTENSESRQRSEERVEEKRGTYNSNDNNLWKRGSKVFGKLILPKSNGSIQTRPLYFSRSITRAIGGNSGRPKNGWWRFSVQQLMMINEIMSRSQSRTEFRWSTLRSATDIRTAFKERQYLNAREIPSK